MPNIRANEKSHRKDAKLRTFNSSEKTKLRTLVKKVRLAVTEKNQEAAQNHLKTVASALDTAAKKLIIHPNSAARRKSRLAVLVNKMSVE